MKEIENVKRMLSLKFKMKDLGLASFKELILNRSPMVSRYVSMTTLRKSSGILI